MGKYTITAITTLVDTWIYQVEEGQELAALAMDQRAAYDLIDHKLLLEKMTMLGMDNQTTNWFRSHLHNIQQMVYIDGSWSNSLHVGGRSVIQGSVLSCALYHIYIMDIPLLFHKEVHQLEQTDLFPKPNIQTFIDDIISTIHQEPGLSLQETVIKSIYMIREV